MHFIKNEFTFLSYFISFGENSKIIKYQMAFLYHISAINVDKNVYIELLSLSNLHTLAFLISSDVYYKIPSIFFLHLKSLVMTYQRFLTAFTIAIFIKVMC